jgi:hypothetical protein
MKISGGKAERIEQGLSEIKREIAEKMEQTEINHPLFPVCPVFNLALFQPYVSDFCAGEFS